MHLFLKKTVEAGRRLWGSVNCHCRMRSHSASRLGKFRVDDVWILLPLVFFYPHLHARVSMASYIPTRNGPTFLNVLKPARILPPVHVV